MQEAVDRRARTAGWQCCLPRLAFFAALLLQLASGATSNARGSDIGFPDINPSYGIRVDAEKYSVAERGVFQVLAFRGNCRISQGEFSGTADEIFLWIDNSGFRGLDVPGKTICYMQGNVNLRWSDQQGLRDSRWMGRLFSFHPVGYSGTQEQRFDIPDLDWNQLSGRSTLSARPAVETAGGQVLRNNTAVQTASGQQPIGGGSSTTGTLATPPPLLPQSSAAGARSSAGYPSGNLPGNNVAQAAGNRYAAGQAAGQVIPSQPGATRWIPENTGSQNRYKGPQGAALPPSGLAMDPIGVGAAQRNAPEVIQPQAGPTSGPTTSPPYTVQQVPTQLPLGIKSVDFSGRAGGPSQALKLTYDPERDESIGTSTGGFQLVVHGTQIPQADGSVIELGSVSLEADNAVIWVRGRVGVDSATVSSPDRPIELYLEGNIVMRQGNRAIFADRMYYNVSSEYGMILSAEVLTPVPEYQGLLRLKADVLQQRDRQTLLAYGAAVTSSRLGVPRYWLQSDEVQIQDSRSDADLAGLTAASGQNDTKLRARAKNNFVYVGGVPILYWPTFSTNLTESSYYLKSVSFGNDDIFGFQARADWDLFALMGWDAAPGSSLRLSTDYLSLRGPAVGFRYEYDRPVWPGSIPAVGFGDGWFIQDDGLDVIGSDRNGLTPEEDLRGRAYSRHRFFLSPNWEATAETGWISDRNFLEQYFENEWEQEKDFDTALRLRYYGGNQQLELRGGAHINDFFTETEWLPKLDHYILGQDILRRFTYNAHSSVAYAHQRPASTPTDPADAAKFAPLPWESDSEGLRALTRQELSVPLSLGPFRFNPYVSGEAAFWGEDVNQDDLTRLTGQAGVRASLPMWKVYPGVENRLFDLRGLAHKATFEAEYFYADSTQNLDLLPLYERLDDNSQEHFRRRIVFNTFGGATPAQFDERGFALRSGMQRWITASSHEIVDDMTQVRLGINQRWQTKRGLRGRERIVDLVSFDVDFTIFPEAERDNFGEELGAVNYDFRYHIGDRLTFLSDGYFDVFSQGLKIINAGTQISRPGRGHAYLGMMSIEGPISASIINGYTEYRMNEKWMLSGGAAFDFGETGSIGQSLALTRIGESALIRVGVNIDHGRDNVSFNFGIEPRFFQSGRLGAPGGELIGPAGIFGLE